MKVVSICGFSSLDVYLEADELSTTVVEHKEKELGIDTLYYKKFSDGTYSYGLIQGAENQFGHSKGYIWSSRASVVNAEFGLNLIEVGINHVSRAIPITTLKSLLPKDFYIQTKKFEDGEEYYAVKCAHPVNNTNSKVLYNMEVICQNQ